jgi:hypothetical protein
VTTPTVRSSCAGGPAQLIRGGTATTEAHEGRPASQWCCGALRPCRRRGGARCRGRSTSRASWRSPASPPHHHRLTTSPCLTCHTMPSCGSPASPPHHLTISTSPPHHLIASSPHPVSPVIPCECHQVSGLNNAAVAGLLFNPRNVARARLQARPPQCRGPAPCPPRARGGPSCDAMRPAGLTL